MTWDRKELKRKGKAAFKANYWKCVAVAFLLLLLVGGGIGAAKSRSEDIELPWNGSQSGQSEQQSTVTAALEGLAAGELMIVLSILAAVVGVVVLFGSLIDILVMNPLEVGCRRFFVRNSEAPAQLGEVGYGFRSWWRCVKTMFLRDLFLFLWGLLLLIPRIVKTYSYRLVPYLLADDPTLGGTEAITVSRRLMDGHKWNAFVLDLSFLGWEILSALTAGLLGIFYVNPYKEATDAELYRALAAGRGPLGGRENL